MYRLVNVNERFRSEEIKIYQLSTVTYGSVPFLVIRCLKQLVNDCSHEYLNASQAINHDLYVDDFFSGVNSVVEATKLAAEVAIIMRSGCFNLKWN